MANVASRTDSAPLGPYVAGVGPFQRFAHGDS